MPNRLTLLYSEIYYKKKNYLKVKTTVFKYITRPIVKVEYISILVYSVYRVPNVPMFLCSELSSHATYVTQLPLVL